ncbi:MAG: cell division protein FtsZ [Bacteroidales bacterium]|nr:cell division protein FtsZ [Bacteroidales bacterium]
MTQFKPEGWNNQKNIIKVIGVGGGGTNAVNYMFSQDIKHVDFVVCNTDYQHLNESKVPVKLQLGPILTKGLGAGTDSLMGRKAATESIDEINKVLDGDTEMVFITCGMGGGTGTGAAPVIAEAAKARNLLTVGVVTIPPRHEGVETIHRANEGIRELSKHVDSLLIIDNNLLYKVYADLTIFEIFPKADEILATAVRSIAEIITCRGVINVDFNDVRKVMKDSGQALMGRGVASGPNRVEDAVNMALKSPLLHDIDLSTTTKLLINITSSDEKDKGISGIEMIQIEEQIAKETGPVISSKTGLVKDPQMEDSVSVTIVATGFEMPPLPFVDEEEINKGNVVRIKYDQKLTVDKRDISSSAAESSTVTKRKRIIENPALIVTNGADISQMESEAAYYRRDRMLAEELKNTNTQE